MPFTIRLGHEGSSTVIVVFGRRPFGRWKSGAPIDLTPDVDDPALGGDPQRNNDFNYIHPGSDLTTDESRCPFTAHIRKTNPRDLEATGLINDQFHAIRAGTPYGPEVTDAESSSHTTSIDRGLAFGMLFLLNVQQSLLTNK